MWSWIALAVGVMLIVGLGLWLALVISMRTKYTPVLTAIRRMNRRFTNPRVMRTAGKPGATYSVIRNEGRSTGSEYRTPIGVLDTDDGGLVITLPYGTSSDWLKNVLAAGSAIVDHNGDSYAVTEPKVVGADEVGRHFSTRERWTNRIYGVDHFLVLRRAEDADAPVGESR